MIPLARLVPLVFLALALMVGCHPSANTGPAAGSASASAKKVAGPSRIIGFSVLTMNNPFFKEIAETMADEASKEGYGVLAVSGDRDPAKQQNQIKDFIVKKARAIVLCPCDSKAVAPAIREATDAGIPVFTCDIACLEKSAGVVSHIATDNFQGGRLAADAIVEALGGKGKVAILDYPEVESVILRTKGFDKQLAELHEKMGANIEVVVRLPGGGDKFISLKATQDILQSHPDVNAIFAINDPSALGARAALESAGKADQVKIVGFDGQPEGKQAIKDGKIFADPIQFPDQIGRKTFQTIYKYLNGEEVPKEILIPTALYRQADGAKDASLK